MAKKAYTTNGSAILGRTIKVYDLVLLALVVVLFAPVLEAAGAPGVIKFAHFAVVPCVAVLSFSVAVEPRLSRLALGMWALLIVVTCSALVNSAGLVNVGLDLLLLAEPFVLLGAIISVPWSPSSINRFRRWLLFLVAIHVLLAYFQRFALGATGDNVVGLFLGGSGSHQAGAVALLAAGYFFVRLAHLSVTMRVALALFFAPVVIFADAKQVIVGLLVSLLILALLTWRHVGSTLRYVAFLSVAVVIVGWLASTIVPQLTIWADTDKIQAGLEQKLTVFPLIASFYDSPLNWLFGMGPGHTVGRLGLLFPDYYDYLRPLGATTSPITQAVWAANQSDLLSNSQTGSSLWALMFSWAGIWGDLGLLGLGTYLYLWWVVWRNFCWTDLSKYLLIVVLVFGAMFDWLEEPAFMLFVVSLVGLEWQENRSKFTDAGPRAFGSP